MKKTVAVLSPGELGSELAKMLSRRGCEVITTLEGRSSRTKLRSEAAGITELATLREVLSRADYVLSTVSNSQAESLAALCARELELLNQEKKPLYIDVNSIAPASVAAIEHVLSAAGVSLVDASVVGMATRLRTQGALYLSGERAREVASLFEGEIHEMNVLGASPGKASLFKMLIGGMNKGLPALFMEMALLAEKAGILEEFVESYRHHYPEIMSTLDRMIPTYADHSARRADELRELEKTLATHGAHSSVTRGAREMIATIAEDPVTRYLITRLSEKSPRS